MARGAGVPPGALVLVMPMKPVLRQLLAPDNQRMGDVACNLLGAVLLLPLGLAFGSFFELVADRVPRGESIVAPPSHCRACGRSLSAAELVPLVSYFAQRGRCRGCGTPIGAGVPLREALSGLALALPWAITGCAAPVFALVAGGVVLAAVWAIRLLIR
jgi:prepilin signal peptidase PulO-like enzyme (type II secretory pathway)